MNKRDYISVHQMKDIFSEPSEIYFQQLEERILSQTVKKAELKERLLFVLQNKPLGFEAFDVDNAYFEGLESSLIQQTTGSVATQPLWQNSLKETPFVVSDTYFDELTSKINSKIPKATKPDQSRLWIPSLVLQPQYMMAAILCLVLGVGFFTMYFRKDQIDVLASLNEISREEISSYVASNSHEIEADYFSETESIVDLKKIKLNETDVNDILFDDEL